ncbi:adaptor complex medium subunit family protein [Nitzschia inconspicua]|uniref:Adaptor complex medium subunit family protein n=1 Tax=Nitzschia inconspicua TaxID=303405 RepID=A0A9K3PUE0_9STRA|nr:adaptor complex medium subunit family protein [Nitzschia inconspicua]
MPGMVMVPKTTNTMVTNPTYARKRMQQEQSSARQSLNAYSLGEESFDSILAMDSPFVKKVDTATNSIKQVEDDDFDPFHIGDAATFNSTTSPLPTTGSSTIAAADALSTVSDASSLPALVPPKMLVKFKVHEEVSSMMSLTEGTSHVYFHGTIQAQVVSSDALKNAPFTLQSSAGDGSNNIEFTGNKLYTKTSLSKEGDKRMVHVVKIPKEIVGFVTVGTYTSSCKIEHMPLLLEQKVVRNKSKLQIAIQVRSKLTNPDELTKFTIMVSIPPRVNSNSIVIVSGEGGKWDRYKRCITWEIEHLPKGQSFMVSAKGALDDTSESPEAAASNEGLDFPVMLRCTSNDQISPFCFGAVQASGYPASVSSSIVGKSFRIIHRLQ